MISVKALEFRMASVIRAGLRQAMRGGNPREVAASLHHAEDRLTSVLYEPLYAQIQKTYSEGYVSGGNLIRRHAPRGTMVTAAAPIPTEDPRIAKATETVLLGISESLRGQRSAIQTTMKEGYALGESIPKLARRLDHYFDNNRATSTMMARTTTNDVFNRAHLDRYEDSGVVDGVQYSAHIDERTSDICQMLNGTIWGLGDRGIQVPPMHFNCRSRLVPWFGKIPGKRDFKGQFGSEFVGKAKGTTKVFRSKYWSPMPHTKASATYQRSYFKTTDTKTIKSGLRATWQKDRNNVTIIRLRSYFAQRKTRGSIISDRSGISMLLAKEEEREIIAGIKNLIAKAERKIAREITKRKNEIEKARKRVEKAHKQRIALMKDIDKRKKEYLKMSPSLQKTDLAREIRTDESIMPVYLRYEGVAIKEHRALIDEAMPDTVWQAEYTIKQYNELLDSFRFQKR